MLMLPLNSNGGLVRAARTRTATDMYLGWFLALLQRDGSVEYLVQYSKYWRETAAD